MFCNRKVATFQAAFCAFLFRSIVCRSLVSWARSSWRVNVRQWCWVGGFCHPSCPTTLAPGREDLWTEGSWRVFDHRSISFIAWLAERWDQISGRGALLPLKCIIYFFSVVVVVEEECLGIVIVSIGFIIVKLIDWWIDREINWFIH